jgi:hypothetical protein
VTRTVRWLELVVATTWLLLSWLPATVHAQPIIHSTVQCTSNLLQGGFYTPVTDRLTLHWKYTSTSDPPTLAAVVEYDGIGWVGLGFSSTGGMVGSQAVVGDSTGVSFYDLNSQQQSGVVQQDPATNPIAASVTGDFTQANQHTNLVFNMNMPTTTFPSTQGLWKMVIAAGDSNILAYHRYRAAFQLDLTTCGGTGTVSTATAAAETGTMVTYNHRAAFAAHGVFAALAFCIVMPFAIAAAWFRSLMPKSWIYIHVLSNCLAFFFTMVAVAVAFGGMVMRNQSSGGGGVVESNASHMSLAHHWIGLFLFLFVIFQVVNGFRRPPVEAKMDLMAIGGGPALPPPEPTSACSCTGQRTPRERWHLTHRITALVVLCLAIYQVQSGIQLFAQEYSYSTTNTTLRVFWIWLLILVGVFLALKVYVCRREYNYQRNTRLPRNIMPQRDEEEYEDDRCPHAETREFANVI